MAETRRKKCMFALTLLTLFCSCTRTQYVTHDVFHHDSIYVTAIAVDTIIQRDSVHTVERGDTVRTTVYKYIYKVRERTDTMLVERTDTIIQTITKEVTVTKKKTDWGKCLWAFIAGIALSAGIYAGMRSKGR